MSSLSDTKRSRPDGRAKKPRRMRESHNDRVIVQYVYQYGMLSQVQFEKLLERSRSTVQRLLRRLYDHHYLERVFLPLSKFGSSPALYVLDREGYALLRRMGIEDFAGLPGKDLSADHLRHMMAINEVHLAIEKGCQLAGYELTTWLNDNRLRSDNVKLRTGKRSDSVFMVPDSYFVFHVPGKGASHCFLELDRGKMQVTRFTDKVSSYVEYYKSGQFNSQFGAQGFRVLTVVDGVGEGRVINIRNASAKQPAIGRRFWFAHLDAISPETIMSSPIWSIAGSDDKISLIT